jgi:chemotaxis protein methyltransferase CheR
MSRTGAENQTVRTELPTDKYQYLTFLGEKPEPVPAALPAERSSPAPRSAFPLENDSALFFETLCGAWGLSASHYRDSILVRRQAACLRSLRASCPIDGALLVRKDSAASERALGAVMIGVTEFFRDPVVFEALRPLLVELRRAAEPFRALSIGCSDGSELYSLAILLAEAGMLSNVRLDGLDCRPAAIRSATAGVYSAAAVKTVGPELRARYFGPATRAAGARAHDASRGPSVQVAEELRLICRWTVGNAFNLPPAVDQPGTRDLILCRNLGIYLTPESAAELWARCIEQLRPGGLLVTGKAERPPAHIRSALERAGPCIYRGK